jgi:hypothetical protein
MPKQRKPTPNPKAETNWHFQCKPGTNLADLPPTIEGELVRVTTAETLIDGTKHVVRDIEHPGDPDRKRVVVDGSPRN